MKKDSLGFNVELVLVNDYAAGEKNGERKTVKCQLKDDSTISNIRDYIEERYELNLDDMWKMVATFNTTQTDLLMFNGMRCTIVKELYKPNYDGGDSRCSVYDVGLENGNVIQAFEDELDVKY